MLESLYVKDLAIVEETRISFGEGLNILTGETGAGKSIIIGSINLALGAKANKNMIRKGKEYAFVELTFSLKKELEEKLRALEIFPEDGRISVARRIGEDRSISRINGETVTLAKAREVSAILLDIHGQQENHSLLYSKNHLEILDRYCLREVSEIKEHLSKSVKEYRKKTEEWEESEKEKNSVERELDFLRYEYREIEEAKLIEGEEEELEIAVRKFSSSEKIMELLNEVEGNINDRSGAENLIGKTVKVVGRLMDLDEGAKHLYSQISELDALMGDFKASLSDFAAQNIFDEEEFRMLTSRLDAIRNIYAKHGGSYHSTMQFFLEAEKKIERLSNFEEYRESLKQECALKKEAIRKDCLRLSTIRKQASETFAKEVRRSLKDLNFLQNEFEVKITTTDVFSSKGYDEVAFLISTNPGEPLKSISEIASGGELSRIMLAIKSVMADSDQIPTLIFDEIDTGISGRTAQKVSEKLAILSENRQIIAITHLAQIAAMADHHFLIEKNSEKGQTATGVKELAGEAVVEELSRILGGAEITESVMVSAKEMKKLADLKKKKS